MRFVVRWPDDATASYYSPSLVVRDYFEVGATYEVATFAERCREALTIASERVRSKYGHLCSLAEAEIARIDATAHRFAEPGSIVRIEGFET